MGRDESCLRLIAGFCGLLFMLCGAFRRVMVVVKMFVSDCVEGKDSRRRRVGSTRVIERMFRFLMVVVGMTCTRIGNEIGAMEVAWSAKACHRHELRHTIKF